jgi:CspA family cold shock protein
MATGSVKFFKPEKGWGAISSDELPPGVDAFMHFSVIEAGGFRTFDEGDLVDFEGQLPVRRHPGPPDHPQDSMTPGRSTT